MTIEDDFHQVKQDYPSAEWFVLRVPFPPGENFSQFVLASYKVNESEFWQKAPVTMLFRGPEGSSGRLGKLHFFYRPEGWNTAKLSDGNCYQVIDQVTNKGPYELADFGFMERMVVPDPEPYWHGPRELAEALVHGQFVEVELKQYTYHTDSTTLMALVRNVGTVSIKDASVHLVFENERFQPEMFGDIPFDTASSSYGLNPEEKFSGTLESGRIEPFVLPAVFFKTAANQAAVLSTERYWLSVRSGTEEIYQVDGRILGQHMERLSS